MLTQTDVLQMLDSETIIDGVTMTITMMTIVHLAGS